MIPENVTRHIIPTIFVWLQNFQEIAYGEFFGGGLHRHFPTVAFAQVANRSLRGLVSHAEREHGIRHAQRQSRILVLPTGHGDVQIAQVPADMGYQRINFVFVGHSQTRASIVQKCLPSIDKASSDGAIGLGTIHSVNEDGAKAMKIYLPQALVTPFGTFKLHPSLPRVLFRERNATLAETGDEVEG